jgi:hypothetical protein
MSHGAAVVDVAGGPSAHDPFPEPDLTPPGDLADGAPPGDPGVVGDADGVDDVGLVVITSDDGAPATGLADGVAAHEGGVFGDDGTPGLEEHEL